MCKIYTFIPIGWVLNKMEAPKVYINKYIYPGYTGNINIVTQLIIAERESKYNCRGNDLYMVTTHKQATHSGII